MIRLGLSRRLFLVVVVAVAVALSGLVAGFNVLLARELSRSADNLVRARAAAELALLHPTPRGLRVGEATDDAAPASQAWVFSQGRALESPRAGEAVARVARSLAGGPARSVDVPSADTRLYALPAVVQGRRMGTIVAGISLVPYEQSRHTALVASLVLGGVVLLLVALAARWLLSSSLRPVRRMTRQAARTTS